MQSFLSALGLTASVGCTSLPDTEFQTHRYREQATRMNNAGGPMTQQQSAVVVAALPGHLPSPPRR